MGRKLIKFATRPNLKHPFQFILYYVLRDIESILIDKYLEFNDPMLFTTLMFIGEFFAGLIVYLYQKQFVKRTLLNDQKKNLLMNIIMKKAEKRIRIIDNIPKMIFILFCCALFDFIQFLLSINTPQFINVSNSFSSRLGGIVLIFDSIFYYFVLKLPIFKHQIFCLIITGVCSLIIVITEFIFQEINIFLSYGKFISFFFISLIDQFFNAMIGLNEKYLYEFNNMDPFYSLLFEGFFGFLFCLFYSIYYNPFEQIIEFKKSKASSEFVILIFCLIIYTILSGLMNLFRVNTTKIFTQMTTSAILYFSNPFYFIIYFSLGEDFVTKKERNYAYFFINLIISLLISFLGLVFNEFIILFFWNLESDTHIQIVKRALDYENIYDLKDIIDDDEDKDDEVKNY